MSKLRGVVEHITYQNPENGSAKRLTALLASNVSDSIAAEPALAYGAQQSTGIVYDEVQQSAINQREFGIRNTIKKLNWQLEKAVDSFGNITDI